MIMGLKYIILHLKWASQLFNLYCLSWRQLSMKQAWYNFSKRSQHLLLELWSLSRPISLFTTYPSPILGKWGRNIRLSHRPFFFHFFLKVNSFLGQGIAKWTLYFVNFLVIRNTFLIKFWYIMYKQKYCMRLPRYSSLNIVHE